MTKELLVFTYPVAEGPGVMVGSSSVVSVTFGPLCWKLQVRSHVFTSAMESARVLHDYYDPCHTILIDTHGNDAIIHVSILEELRVPLDTLPALFKCLPRVLIIADAVALVLSWLLIVDILLVGIDIIVISIIVIVVELIITSLETSSATRPRIWCLRTYVGKLYHWLANVATFRRDVVIVNAWSLTKRSDVLIWRLLVRGLRRLRCLIRVDLPPCNMCSGNQEAG